MGFCWTDERLQKLVKEYWGYLKCEEANELDPDFDQRCVEKLQTVFKSKPMMFEISEKLKDLASAYGTKDVVTCFLSFFSSCFHCQI